MYQYIHPFFRKLFAITILGFTAACISPLDVDFGSKEFFVISGVVSNSPKERIITVSTHDENFIFGRPHASTGAIYKDGNHEADLLPGSNAGELHVPLTLEIEEGAAYFIEVKTASGLVIRSAPVVVQARLQTIDLTFEVVQRAAQYNEFGVPDIGNYLRVFATVSTNSNQSAYYKWQVDEAWSHTENPPLGRTCYVTNTVADNPITVFDSDGLSSAESKILILDRLIDESFLEIHYINAYAHSISKQAALYYQNALRLSNIQGTLYDEIPAPLEGNLSVVSGGESELYGFVDFSLADTLRLRLDQSDIKLLLNDRCDAVPACKPGSPFGPPPPCRCRDCAQVFGQNTLIKPEYWFP